VPAPNAAGAALTRAEQAGRGSSKALAAMLAALDACVGGLGPRAGKVALALSYFCKRWHGAVLSVRALAGMLDFRKLVSVCLCMLSKI
jgi:hypothetical protein